MRSILLTVLFTAILSVDVQAQDPDSVAEQDSLLLQLQREMGAVDQVENPSQSVRARPSTNPDISVIGDTRAWYVSEGDRTVDFALHEVETAFKSVIDPFARADVYIAAHNEDGEIEIHLEEAYLTTLALPYQFQVRAGKFRSNVGKINRTHPHALPYPDKPAVYENYFGEEGLNDEGIGISWLVPNRAFYQEISLEVTRGPGDSEIFEASEKNNFLYAAHLKNFWDLSSDATFELGVSGLAGPNSYGLTTWIAGIDATFKWKPVRFNTYQSFTAQVETFFSRMETGNSHVSTWGMYGLASYQLARRWILIGRFDHSDLPADPNWNENGISGTLAWYLTEFQKIEIGIQRKWGDNLDTVYSAVVRAVFVIGTHGAHEY